MTNRRKPQQTAARGSAKAVDVTIGDKRSRAFLVTVENHGKDEQGRIVGANGIKWKVGR